MEAKDVKDPGQWAFEVYNEAVGGKTYDGKPLHWGMIGERQREGWKAVEEKGSPRFLLGLLNGVYAEAKRAADAGAEAVYDFKLPPEE